MSRYVEHRYARGPITFGFGYEYDAATLRPLPGTVAISAQLTANATRVETYILPVRVVGDAALLDSVEREIAAKLGHVVGAFDCPNCWGTLTLAEIDGVHARHECDAGAS